MQNNIDELPIGGGQKANELGDEFASTSNAASAEASGPLEERVLSKNWSVRATAFEELLLAFK